MSDRRKIYHITHLDNLPRIVGSGLWTDMERIRQSLPCTIVGMSEIKRRRLEELEVRCHPGTKVGQYVPFYFCAQSIMLYLLHKRNHQDITYRGGQGPILHLEAQIPEVVRWADSIGRRWAFTKGNAGARYTQFFAEIQQLEQLNWASIHNNDWRDPIVKDWKQSEFLVEQSFPWKLVRRIGVIDANVAATVRSACVAAHHHPEIVVEPNWYY
jgi:hypothetical protein